MISFYIPSSEQLAESPYMYELLGLDLLCLLAQNKVGEFHTTLEHLPAPVITDNVYIRHPVAMEQYLMEGAYNKVQYSKGRNWNELELMYMCSEECKWNDLCQNYS